MSLLDVGARARRLLWFAAVLAALGLVLWWWVVPHWRPAAGPREVYGVDVSHHQGLIDWDAMADDDIDFAYIKATEGGDWLDSQWEHNWAEAERVGLRRGAYHFFTLCRPAAEQAEWFLKHAPPTPRALAPSVDLEFAGNCSARPPAADLYAELDIFLAAVEEAWGTQVVLYVGDDWEREYPVIDRLDRPVWLQGYPWRPGVDNLRIWQLHGFAQVDGVDGPVDLNIGPGG